jgi:drug/metabolite transporter (DMT)-like permease
MDTLSAPVHGNESRSEWTSWLLLALAVVSTSTSAILIRYASGADPLAISFWRCAAGAAVLAPFTARRPGKVASANLARSLMAGAFLAVHFGTWITSVNLTTVAASVLLVSTTPVFVAAAAWMLFGERLERLGWLGIGLTLVGVGLIAGGGFTGSSPAGNLLALTGGLMAAGYLLAGRAARRELGIIEYAVLVYGTAALFLLCFCVAAGTPLWGYPALTWWAIAGIVVGPQLLGHTLINWALKDIDPTTVAVTIMVEPVVSTLLAFALFSELPSALVYPGGALILLGIYLVSAARVAPAYVG